MCFLTKTLQSDDLSGDAVLPKKQKLKITFDGGLKGSIFSSYPSLTSPVLPYVFQPTPVFRGDLYEAIRVVWPDIC